MPPRSDAPPAAADVRRPVRTAWFAWGAWMALCAALLLRTPFTADLSAFLPAAPDAAQRVLIDQIRSGTPARTWMIAIESPPDAPAALVAQRQQLAAQLGKALVASGRFEQVHRGDRSDYAGLAQWVVERRYALSPAVRPERFQPEGLRAAIDDTLSLLGTPAGIIVKPLLERDPTGETQQIAEAALGSGGPPTVDGNWASRDGRRALLLAIGRAEGSDIDAQQATLQMIEAQWAALKAPAALQLVVSGAPRFSVDSRARIEREATALAITGSVLVTALLWFAFRSWRVLGIATLPVVTGVVAGMTAVSIGYGHIHGITLGFGSTLIGEAVDYAIYYLIQARRGRRPDGAAAGEPGWRLWLREGWPTVRLGLLTSLVGFVALVVSGFVGLAQLGVFSIAGLVAAAATARLMLPRLAPDGAPAGALVSVLGRAGRAFVDAAPKLKLLSWLLGAAALALLAARGERLWQGELTSLSPLTKQELDRDAALRAEFGDVDGGALVAVQGRSLEATLQGAERAGRALDALIAEGVVQGYESAARLLPSAARQEARRAALPPADALHAAIASATEGGPLRAARLQPFADAVAAARTAPALTWDSVRASPAGPMLATLLMPRTRADDPAAANAAPFWARPPFAARAASDATVVGWTALMPVRPVDPAQGPAMLARVQQAVAAQQASDESQVQALDIGSELRRTYRHYLHEAMRQAWIGAAAVVLLMAVVLRSPRRLAAVCLPLALSVAITMGGLALAGVKLSILHLVGLLLTVAIGSNYALFFDVLAQRRNDGAVRDAASRAVEDETLASLMLANATTVLSFGLIALSSVPALSDIGRVVAPGALLSMVLAAALARRGTGLGSGRNARIRPA